MLTEGGRTYSYDTTNRLTSYATGDPPNITFRYNGLGNRLTQTVNGQETTYILDLATGLTQVLHDGTHTYLYGNMRLAQQDSTSTEYFLTDALGSVRQMVDENGELTLTQAYQPLPFAQGRLYGEPMTSSGSGASPYGFAGEWTDATGLQNLRARYYTPTQGRFLTRDTFAGDYTRPASLHRYTYAENNPALYTDPSGRCVFGLDTLGCIVVGVGIFTAAALWMTIPYYDEIGPAVGRGVVDVIDACDSLVDQFFRTVGKPYVIPQPEFRPTGTLVPPIGFNSTTTPFPTPTSTPEPDKYVRVRHYSYAINSIRSQMLIRGDFAVWVEFPRTTSYDWPDIQKTITSFGRDPELINGFVEFDVNLNKWLMRQDPNLPGTHNAKIVELFTLDGDPSYLSKGFPLSEVGVNPKFFDKFGKPLE